MQNLSKEMIYIYYHILYIEDYKDKIRPFYIEAKKFGLETIIQKRNQPDYFMEVITARDSIGEQLKGLSELRMSMGINKLILNDKIHVEIFDNLFEDEDSTEKKVNA